MSEDPRGFELGTDGPSLILAGIDGSRTSLRAAAYAAGMARRQGCPLALVYVPQPVSAAGVDVNAAAASLENVRSIAADLQARTALESERIGVRTEFLVRDGDPFTQITKAADVLRADAVVVGASEKAGHRLVGSLATRLVKAGRWPVTVVP
jgi:nucleotide-binding universal stress UspA family protein